MALVIPWLLVREYQQHRNLDYYGLPETFEEWREAADALADQLARVTGRRVVKVVIHPGELEEWARRQGRAVSAQVRSEFAGAYGLAGRSHLLKPSGVRRHRVVAVRDRSRGSAGWAVARTIRAAHISRLPVRSQPAQRFPACPPPEPFLVRLVFVNLRLDVVFAT